MALPAGRRGVRADLVNFDGTISDLTKAQEDVATLKEGLTNLITTKLYTATITSGAFFIDLPTGVNTSQYEFIAQPYYGSTALNDYTIALQKNSISRLACYLRRGTQLPPDGSTAVFLLVCIKVR